MRFDDDLNGVPVDDSDLFPEVSRCSSCQSNNTKMLEYVLVFCHDCHRISNVYRYVGEPPDDQRNYPHTLWIAFRSPVSMPQYGDDNWQWMSNIGRELGALLVAQDLGYNDGFGGGFGVLDVHFFVNDIDRAATAILDKLTDDEHIQYAKILSHRNDIDPGNWRVHYPPAAPAESESAP